MQDLCRVGATRIRPKGHVTAEHKFRAGPERDGEFEYRIKSMSEPHERVARESELARD